jgi:hypothetical protein
MPMDTNPDQTPRDALSPETYLGSKRMEYFYPDGGVNNGSRVFNLADNLVRNSFSLGGGWTISDENAVTGQNAILNYNFVADKVFLVLRPGTATNPKVKVYVDGKLVDDTNAGSDVKNGEVIIDSDRLYNLVDLRGKTENHVLRLEFSGNGIEAFAFTFG